MKESNARAEAPSQARSGAIGLHRAFRKVDRDENLAERQIERLITNREDRNS